MLIGEYIHTLDEKKRISLPSKFRKELGKRVVVTRGLDKCLFVYPIAQWEKSAERLAGLSIGQSDTRQFNRFFLAGAVEIEVDQLGRILIPDFLKTFAGLGERVVVAGVYARVELWDEETWNSYSETIVREADSLAQRLGELGAF